MGGDPDIIRRWQANLQAEKLRRFGLSYEAIRIVMIEYHDVTRSAEQWRAQLRRQGCPPSMQGRHTIGRPVVDA